MGIDMKQFDKDAQAAAQRLVSRVSGTITSAAQYLYSELQKDAKREGIGSPIASGRYVASMRIAINDIDTSAEPADPTYHYPPGKGPRPLPPRTISNKVTAQSVAALLRGFKLGDKIFISNSLPYSRRIEVGGHSWQAPGGVFAPTVRKVLVRFKNVNIGVTT